MSKWSLVVMKVACCRSGLCTVASGRGFFEAVVLVVEVAVVEVVVLVAVEVVVVEVVVLVVRWKSWLSEAVVFVVGK